LTGSIRRRRSASPKRISADFDPLISARHVRRRSADWFFFFPPAAQNDAFDRFAHAELRNYGQVPAYDLTVKSNVKIDGLENVLFDDFPGVERGVPSIAFRDAGLHVNVGWPISEEDKIVLYERKKVFFFWGTAEYRDAFDKRLWVLAVSIPWAPINRATTQISAVQAAQS
jgi:hypothetical protein